MSKYTRVRTPLLAALAALAAGAAACGGDKKNDALTQDTALSRDLAMAGSDTSAQPALQDVPTTTPPAVAPPTTPAPRGAILPRTATRTGSCRAWRTRRPAGVSDSGRRPAGVSRGAVATPAGWTSNRCQPAEVSLISPGLRR